MRASFIAWVQNLYEGNPPAQGSVAATYRAISITTELTPRLTRGFPRLIGLLRPLCFERCHDLSGKPIVCAWVPDRHT